MDEHPTAHMPGSVVVDPAGAVDAESGREERAGRVLGVAWTDGDAEGALGGEERGDWARAGLYTLMRRPTAPRRAVKRGERKANTGEKRGKHEWISRCSVDRARIDGGLRSGEATLETT